MPPRGPERQGQGRLLPPNGAVGTFQPFHQHRDRRPNFGKAQHRVNAASCRRSLFGFIGAATRMASISAHRCPATPSGWPSGCAGSGPRPSGSPPAWAGGSRSSNREYACCRTARLLSASTASAPHRGTGHAAELGQGADRLDADQVVGIFQAQARAGTRRWSGLPSLPRRPAACWRTSACALAKPARVSAAAVTDPPQCLQGRPPHLTALVGEGPVRAGMEAGQ